MRSKLPRPAAAATLVASMLAVPAVAQTDETEIIVTARKRAELMEKIPLSIGVVSEATIEKLGAQTYTDLLRTVPSLTAYQNGPGRTRLSIRGVANGGGNDNDTQNQETVGIYIDEVPVSAGALNPEIALFDVERVEVLRGPQGTLYGAGSMTGTVRIVTRRPNLQEVQGKAETSLSTIAHGGFSYDLKALANIPIVQDKLAVRVNGYYTHNGGYIDNVLTHEKDVNAGTAKGGRITVRAQPTDKFTADFSYFHHKYSDGGRPEELVRVPGHARDYPSRDGFDDKLDIFNLTLNYDLGFADIVSSTSYFDRTPVNRRSLDGLFVLFPGVTPHELVDITKFRFYAEEVRVTSKGDGPFQWIVGAYTDRKDTNYQNTIPVPGFDAVMHINSADFGAPKDYPYYGYDKLRVDTYAFFGELSYKLGNFTATAGLRYFNWKQRYKYYQSGFLNGPAVDPPLRESTEDGINPKFNLSYQATEDTLVYAQAARGFRYGGVNGVIPESVCAAELNSFRRGGGDPTAFTSDHLWNYEIGTKGRYAGGRVSVNATAYYIEWSDIQTSRSLTCGFGFRENVGAVTSKGLELELTLRPTAEFTFTFGGSYTDTTLDKDVANLSAKAGDRAPFVPRYQFNASAEYHRPIWSGEGFVWGNVQHVGNRYTEFSRLAPLDRKMDAYTIVNSRVGMRWGEAELSVFANNLFDSDGVIRALYRPPFDPEAKIRVTPRTIGVTARYAF